MTNERKGGPTRAELLVVGILCLVVISMIALVKCGSKPKPNESVPVPTQPAPPPTPPGPTPPGPTPPAPPTPTPPAPPTPPTPPPAQKPCDQVTTFDELQPLVSLNCASCHVGFDQYDKAAHGTASLGADAGKPLIDAMLRRIGLDQTNPDHMPAQRAKLADKDIAVFQKWKDDGFLKAGDCIGTAPQPDAFRDFAWTEQQMFADANTVQPGDQLNIRYLIAIDQVNYGTPASLGTAKLAAVKAINSISGARDVQPLVAVAPGIWRFNINDLRLNFAQWKLVENASQLQFESFTQTGLALKGLTNTRLPWMFVQDFNDTALRNANVYYGLTNAPANLAQFLLQKGVNFAGDLANFRAFVLAFNGSSLSPAANRLIERFDSNDGACWLTEDTGPIVNAQQNVFQNPLPDKAAGGKANLKFAAGEQLCSLPNGLLQSFLANAAGTRLNEADANVVHDFTVNPISPIIKNGISCYRCHAGGILHATDAVLAALPQQNISADDAQRVKALYKPQAETDKQFAKDNTRFAAALTAMGLDPTGVDPISGVSDAFLGDLKAAYLAGLLFLRPQELTDCINVSQLGRQQVGQILTGTVSHDQLVPALAALKADCRIFQDPIGSK